MNNQPGFWEAIWTLVSSPFMVAVFVIMVVAVIVVSIADRGNQS